MKSLVAKHSIVIAGHRTSVSLEEAFWRALKDIAHHQAITVSDLVGAIDVGRDQSNLSSTLRLFVLESFRAPPTELSEDRAGVAKLNGGQQSHM
jgi:predicted DNA-binding ribbon-helix-helix protein